MKKNTLIILFCLLMPWYLSAQVSDEYWNTLKVDPANYTSITDSFNAYIANQYPDSIPQSALGNIKNYYRHLYFWNSRLGLINDTLSYLPYAKAGLNNVFDPYCDVDDAADWQLMGPDSLRKQFLGLVDEVLSDPLNEGNYLLSSGNGGIWKNQTTGNSWVNVTDNLKLPGIHATEMIRNPFDNNHILASTGGGTAASYGMGIIESLDNGFTWSMQEEFPYTTCPYVQKIIIDPNDVDSSDGLTLWAITQNENLNKIYYTNNTGLDWNPFPGPTLPTKTLYKDIEIDDQGAIWVTTISMYNEIDGGIYKFYSGIWHDLSDDFEPGMTFQQASLTKPYDGKVFVKLDNSSIYGEVARVYKSMDYGSTWSFLVQPHGYVSNKNQYEMEYSPASGIIYFGGIKIGLMMENDPSGIISFRANHDDIRDFDIMGIDSIGYENVLVATDGGISLLKVNKLDINDYQEQNLNGNHLPIGDFLGLGTSHSDDEFIVAGAVHCHSFKYEGGSWTRFFSGDGGDSEVNWDDQNIYYAQGNQLMLGYGGQPNLDYHEDNWFIGMEYELNPNDPYKVYFGRSGKNSNSGKLVIWDQNNPPYIERQGPFNSSNKINSVGAIGVNKENTIFIADYSPTSDVPFRFNKSVNDGANWTDMSFKPVMEYINGVWISNHNLAQVLKWRTIQDIVFNPDNPNEMWISIGGVQTSGGEPFAERFRVLHSTDLGEEWYDYSENLSPFPVIALEYQAGSNKRLFAGSDAGVYYRDASMSQWECFNDGLPVCIISDLDYDPCNKLLYASTNGRAIFKTEVPFIDTVLTYLDSNQLINWDSPKEIVNNLIIPATTTLSISSNVYLMEDVKIIIKPGGKLIIDGGLLTNQCGNFWHGIEVWGDLFASQTEANQGTLQIKNGGIIANAEVAVRVGSENYSLMGGGIVNANNGVFTNNNIGVRFDPYYGSNLSRFTNCSFDYEKSLDPAAHFTHVKLDNVKHIYFTNCDFSNNSDSDCKGYGIYSSNSIFYIDQKCSSYSGSDCITWDRSEFENLNYGIYATASNTTRFADIRNTDFTDNYRGIYLSGMTLPTVLSNAFYMDGSVATSNYGLYLDECTDYWVENNNFEESTSDNNNNNIGIIVNESGSDPNEIYRNTFDNMEYGILAQGANRNGRTGKGLVCKCNTFTNGAYDITVTTSANPWGSSNDGIAQYQGSSGATPDAPAGNRFSWKGPQGTPTDINNEGMHFTYYYHVSSTEKLEPKYYTTATVTAIPNPDAIWNPETSCPSRIPTSTKLKSTGGDINWAKIMNMAATHADSLHMLIQTLEDAGDTDAMKTDIELSLPEQSLEVYNQLMNSAPYISDTVMASAIQKEAVLPDVMIRDVMVANPEAAKDDELLQKLDERSTPLPEYMLGQILQGRSLVTVYGDLMAQQSFYSNQYAMATNHVLRQYLADTTNTAASTDSIKALLTMRNCLQSNYNLVFLHLMLNETPEAISILQAIPLQFEIDQQELEAHEQISDFVELMLDMDDNSPDSTQIAALYTQASADRGIARIYARNMLLAMDLAEYNEPIIRPDITKSAQAEEFERLSKLANEHKYMELFPNPAADYFVVKWQMESKPEKLLIRVTDYTGTPVMDIPATGSEDQKLIPTQNLKSGVYVISLVMDNKIIDSQKLSILK